jgi:ATP-binding cassette subfamily C protein CydC
MSVQLPPPRGREPLSRLVGLARPLRGRLALAVVTGAAATGCAVALLATSGFLLARASQHPSIVAVTAAVVAVRAFSVGRGVFRYLERLSAHDVAFRVLADLRVSIYRRLERLAPAGLHAFRSGDLLARLVSDVDSVQDLFIRGIAPPLAAVLVGAGAVAACLLVLVPAAGLLAAGILLGGLLAPVISVTADRRARRRTAAARGQLAATVANLVSGSADLNAFGAEQTGLDRADAADTELTRLARVSAAAAGSGIGLGSLIAGLTLWGVLVLGVAAVGSGALGRVPLAVLTLTALASFETVAGLPAAAQALGHARASSRRVCAVLDAPDPVRVPTLPRPAPRAPVTVSLRAASVRYESDAPLALDGLDLDLVPGRRVALVGPNGAGKSTVAALLLRFCDLAAGSASLCGHDLASYDPDDVRAVIGGCPQDPHIFAGTIAANLRVARPGATDAELADAAARVHLLPWILSLPQGFETAAGARGAAISGGERQRIALARALLADPAVLILDEPTACLEPLTARAVMAGLLAVTAARAILLITHDLDVLEQMDEIVVLDRGRVAERGRHDELNCAGGRYVQMQRHHQTQRRPTRLLLRSAALPRGVDCQPKVVLLRNGQIGPYEFHGQSLKCIHDRVEVRFRAQQHHRRTTWLQVLSDRIDHRGIDRRVLQLAQHRADLPAFLRDVLRRGGFRCVLGPAEHGDVHQVDLVLRCQVFEPDDRVVSSFGTRETPRCRWHGPGPLSCH